MPKDHQLAFERKDEAEHSLRRWKELSLIMKAKRRNKFAEVEENLNAEGEKHTKKEREGRVKSEVHARLAGRPWAVEEREGEILGLARQVEELQAKLKHLRGLAQEEGNDTILDDADEANS